VWGQQCIHDILTLTLNAGEGAGAVRCPDEALAGGAGVPGACTEGAVTVLSSVNIADTDADCEWVCRFHVCDIIAGHDSQAHMLSATSCRTCSSCR